MKKKLINNTLAAALIIGLLLMLRFVFEMPYVSIGFLIAWGSVAGLTGLALMGYTSPPDSLYKNRLIIQGLGFGIFIGITLFGTEAIEDKAFLINDLLQLILTGTIVGLVFYIPKHFTVKKRLKKRNVFLQDEKLLVSDLAQLIQADGTKQNGALFLSEKHLVFYDKMNHKKVMEEATEKINPEIHTTRYLNIPNGLIINENVVVRIPCPYYWLQKMGKTSNRTR